MCNLNETSQFTKYTWCILIQCKLRNDSQGSEPVYMQCDSQVSQGAEQTLKWNSTPACMRQELCPRDYPSKGSIDPRNKVTSVAYVRDCNGRPVSVLSAHRWQRKALLQAKLYHVIINNNQGSATISCALSEEASINQLRSCNIVHEEYLY